MPQHNHAAYAASTGGLSGPASASPAAWGSVGKGHPSAYAPPGTAVTMSPQALSLTGSSQPHNNLQPYLTLNFCIALQGIYPPRT